MTYIHETKEAYLTFRAEWKRTYRELSDEIRRCKRWRADAARQQSAAPLRDPANMKSCIKKHSVAYLQVCPHSVCRNLRGQAAEMLENLKLAKQAAQEAYLRQHSMAA